MSITVFGIKNCNTMKKCFDYLADKGVAYEFFDYKKSVLDAAAFADFVGRFGKDKLINKQGTTYRKLDDAAKAVLAGDDVAAIYAIAAANQSLLKRPVVVGEHCGCSLSLIGFDVAAYDAVFGSR